MNRKTTRILFGFMALFTAAFMVATNDQGFSFPFILFPTGLLIAGIGTFFHGPTDPLPANGEKYTIREKTGVFLLLIGVVLMISSALLKFFGFGISA